MTPKRFCRTPRCKRQWQDTTRKKCTACGQPTQENKHIELPQGRGHNVIPDIPEHYNESFDAVVKGRRHLKGLQKEQGTHDWEPMRGSRASEQIAENERRFRHEGRLR